MNLATMALRLYLRNPTMRSSMTDDPLIVLPNGKRIIIQTWDEPIDRARPFETFTYYRICREYCSSRGTTLTLIKDCYDIEGIAKLLAEEASKPEPRMPGVMFYPRSRR